MRYVWHVLNILAHFWSTTYTKAEGEVKSTVMSHSVSLKIIAFRLTFAENSLSYREMMLRRRGTIQSTEYVKKDRICISPSP